MNIRLIPAEQMTPEQVGIWAEIQRADPAFDSPYFRPEFTQAVAAVRSGVEIAVLEDYGTPVGFFPFQRTRRNVALPVGGRMSDFHGLIVRNGVEWNARQLLRACGLRAWHFDHLIADQKPFQPYHWSVAPSPYLDLSHGWEGYQSGQLATHGESFKRAISKWRRAEREAGPLRVEIDSHDPTVFPSLIKWKVDQYRRTQVTNVLAFEWTTALLKRIAATKGEAFSGMVSALYMGDVLTAVVLSMRSYGVAHGWFSAYRPNFASLSPGLVLWLELAKRCPELGIQRIDLGKGPEEYKRRLMSGAISVAEGSVDLRPMARMIRRNWRRAYQWASHSSLRRPLLAPGRLLRTMVESRSFR
jgi:CelD/BcsL family acetyltransferase involved in cellulose biosynthesis